MGRNGAESICGHDKDRRREVRNLLGRFGLERAVRSLVWWSRSVGLREHVWYTSWCCRKDGNPYYDRIIELLWQVQWVGIRKSDVLWRRLFLNDRSNIERISDWIFGKCGRRRQWKLWTSVGKMSKEEHRTVRICRGKKLKSVGNTCSKERLDGEWDDKTGEISRVIFIIFFSGDMSVCDTVSLPSEIVCCSLSLVLLFVIKSDQISKTKSIIIWWPLIFLSTAHGYFHVWSWSRTWSDNAKTQVQIDLVISSCLFVDCTHFWTSMTYHVF